MMILAQPRSSGKPFRGDGLCPGEMAGGWGESIALRGWDGGGCLKGERRSHTQGWPAAGRTRYQRIMQRWGQSRPGRKAVLRGRSGKGTVPRSNG